MKDYREHQKLKDLKKLAVEISTCKGCREK